MKNSCTGKKDFVAMKLDMSKAYDWVEWVFLEKILLKMGFLSAWVALIMEVHYHYIILYSCER